MLQQPLIKKNKYSLAYMPGAGGNFLSRCLNFHPEINYYSVCVNKNYQQKYEILNYKNIQNRKNPKTHDWQIFEHKEKLVRDDPNNSNIKNIINSSHIDYDCDIRITNYSKEEFDWARHQALYKNAVFCLSWLKSGQLNNQKVSVPCKNLWDFQLLSESLTNIETYIAVEKNNSECRRWQKTLWKEWKLTWAPKQIKKILDMYYYGPKN